MIGGWHAAADFDWAGRRELVGQFTRFIYLVCGCSGSNPRGDGGAGAAAFFLSFLCGVGILTGGVRSGAIAVSRDPCPLIQWRVISLKFKWVVGYRIHANAFTLR